MSTFMLGFLEKKQKQRLYKVTSEIHEKMKLDVYFGAKIL